MAKRKRLKTSIYDYDTFINKQNRCSICGKQLNNSDKTLDHYIPLSKGGRNVKRNLFVTCFNCNFKKGNKIYKPEEIYKFSKPNKAKFAKEEYKIWVQYNLKTILKRTKLIFVYIQGTLIEIPFDRNLYLYDKNNLHILKRVENRYTVPNIDLIEEQIVIPIENIETNEPYYDDKTRTCILLVTDRSKLDEARNNIIEFGERKNE